MMHVYIILYISNTNNIILLLTAIVIIPMMNLCMKFHTLDGIRVLGRDHARLSSRVSWCKITRLCLGSSTLSL